MQWEPQWEWKAWVKVLWVKPWAALCKMECQEQWAELWQALWQEVQLVQVIWVRWETWVEPWTDLKVEPWAVLWETWVEPWAAWAALWVI